MEGNGMETSIGVYKKKELCTMNLDGDDRNDIKSRIDIRVIMSRPPNTVHRKDGCGYDD
jgi:hypothetical protein